jgi:hypothetical protein
MDVRGSHVRAIRMGNLILDYEVGLEGKTRMSWQLCGIVNQDGTCDVKWNYHSGELRFVHHWRSSRGSSKAPPEILNGRLGY